MFYDRFTICHATGWVLGLGAGGLAFIALAYFVWLLPAFMVSVAIAVFVAMLFDLLICGRGRDYDALAVAKAAGKPATTGLSASPAPKAEPEPKPEPEPKAEIVAAPVAAVSTADVGQKPAGMSGPRDGGADDLKQIKGVGPKLEKLLHSMGFYHFDQIAGWSSDEVAWVDENLEGFKGRVSRDGWIDQAKT
ncbi:MAG: NADH:ubiquinone oxidoreductase, partial [Pseudomonadota bacterium]